MDYDIHLNDVVQLMIKSQSQILPVADEKGGSTADESVPSCSTTLPVSNYYKVDDKINYLDSNYGAWFDGTLVEILNATEPADETKSSLEPNLLFKVKSDS